MVAIDMNSKEQNGYATFVALPSRVTVSSFCQLSPLYLNDFLFSYFDTN